jgi:hypothetical protein
MLRKIVVLAFLLMLPFSAMAANPNLAGDTPDVVITGADSAIKLHGTENFVKPNPVATASVTNIATTSLTIITPMPNRSRLVVMHNDQDKTKAGYLMLGSNTVSNGTGVRIDEINNVVDVEAGAGVLASVISSSAVELVVIQLARP